MRRSASPDDVLAAVLGGNAARVYPGIRPACIGSTGNSESLSGLNRPGAAR